MQPHFRPLSFGEILDAAFTLYRRNFLRFFTTSLAFGVGMVVVAVMAGTGAAVVIQAFGGVVAVLGALLVATAVLGMVMAMWGALTWQAARAYAGQKTSLGDALDASMESAGSLAGVGMMGAVLLLVAAILPGALLGMPLMGMGRPAAGAMVMLAWGMAATLLVCSGLFAALPAVMVEERGPLQAMARSFQLASGSVGRIAAVMLVALLITMLPGLGLGVVTGGLADLMNPAAATQETELRDNLLGWALNLLTAPFLASVCVVLYYDRRVRAEALDVQMVTDRLALAGD